MKLMTRRILILSAAAIVTSVTFSGISSSREPVHTTTIQAGDLRVSFRDNSDSPRVLSGVQSLFNVAHAPDLDAFDPQGRGSSAGLNFEHIISGHNDPANRFTPRHGTYRLFPESDGRSVSLVREADDSPWRMSSTMRYTLAPPHAIDMQFRCTPRDANRFGERGYAILFWANYMNDVADVALNFRGVKQPDGAETWISVDAPKGHPHHNGGGTYRAAEADPLEYDEDHNFKLNVWSYDTPRITRPFYYGRAAGDMVMILMFDRLWNPEDEIRFSLFKFKLPEKPRPAWDFQYVIHKVEQDREYGFRARLVWKKFVSPEDCLQEYKRWSKSLE